MRALKLAAVVWTVATTLRVADALYRFQVGVLSFSNPSGTDRNGQQCDPFDSTCDYVFDFCLQESHRSDCNLGVISTQHHNIQQNTYTFTLNDELIPGSGISNPLVYTDRAPLPTGNPWPVNFYLRIEIEDYDSGSHDPNDEVDIITIWSSQRPSDEFTSAVSYTGVSGKVTMRLQFRLQCQTNWYRDNCFTHCVPPSPDNGQHYMCNQNGNLVCLEGYTGDNCDVSACSPACVNGQCIGTNNCSCTSGWTGPICDVCTLASDCPADRATCNSPGDCNCIQGYSGTLCQNDDDVCGHTSPCLNGTCTNAGPNDYTCSCSFGYTGTNCETEVDACDSPTLPCQNGGTCTPTGPGLFNCSCTEGWTGTTCEEDIDECNPVSPCVNGTCENCVPTGPTVVDPSDPNFVLCPHGYICNCQPGFYGDNCDLDVDECDPSLCVNEGVCHDVMGAPGYSCLCPPGFTGRNCETDVDECAESAPCLNGGNCTNHFGYYNCSCPNGFLGNDCQIDIDECLTANCSTDNTLDCVNGPGTFTCVCKSGYTGSLCDIEVDLCLSVPCQNNGTCTTLFNDFECECATGFTGVECDVDIDYCASPEVCLNGGTCVDGLTSYTCECLAQFTGRQCETSFDPCDPFPCQPGQGCIIEHTGIMCVDCALISEDSTMVFSGCGPEVIGPGSLTGNKTESVDPVLIGGVIGGVVGGILLFLLLVVLFVCCLKFCACCCLGVKRKETETEFKDFPNNAAQSNPLYMGTNTLLSNQSGTLRSAYGSMPRPVESPAPQNGYERLANSSSSADGEGDPAPLQNPAYDITQTQIGRGSKYQPPPLPTRNSSNSLLTNKVSFLPVPGSDNPHYETIPAQQQPAFVASGKYDSLAAKSSSELDSSLMKTGQYDSLGTSPPLSPTKQNGSMSVEVPRATDNPYILSPKREVTQEMVMAPSERGEMYVMLPPVTAFASLKEEAKSTEAQKPVPELQHEVPTSKENPYELS